VGFSLQCAGVKECSRRLMEVNRHRRMGSGNGMGTGEPFVVCKLVQWTNLSAVNTLNFFYGWLESPFRRPCYCWRHCCAGIFKQSMGARNRVGIGLSYRPPRLHRLVELIPWNRLLVSLIVLNFGLSCLTFLLLLVIAGHTAGSGISTLTE
jgi:hypothetical protein